MNKRQKLVQQAFLNNEEAVIRRLKQVYGVALKDIEKKAQALQDDIGRLDTMARLSVDADEKAKLLSMKQSKVYQKQYQDALRTQVSSVLDNMQVEEFRTVSEYLQKCYEDGFVGTMFDLQGQGIPLCFPMDQEAMVRAVQLDSKISHGLYSRLGEDVALLKKKITAQVSRGIATGASWQQTAQQLAGYTNIGYNNAIRIARTEGHRIQVQSAMDACNKAKEKGADVVKQWDATLDSSTRESHAKVDGEIRELDEKFSNGLMFPGDPSGGAAEVINCRCALLQRARWALDEAELETLKERAEYFGLDKTDNFEDFKKKYLNTVKDPDFITDPLRLDRLSKEDFNKWKDKYYNATNGKVNLTADELKALDDYGEGGYELLNAYGRYGEDSDEFRAVLKKYGNPDVESVKKRFEDVQSALGKFQLDDDIVVHRAVRNVSYMTDDVSAEGLKNLKGKVITEDGFVSTSFTYQSKFTGRSPDAVHMEIVVPKGSSGAYIDKFVAKDEQEFLLSAGTKYRVIDGGERIVKSQKYDFKTRSWIEVETKERFLKVQVIVDDVAEEIAEEVLENSVSARIFVPASSKTEAVDYAKRFKVDADYSKYNLDVANSINETISRIEDTFGSKALDQLHRIGTFPQGFSSRYKGAYVRSSDPNLDGSLWLRNVGTKSAMEKLESVAKEAFEGGEWSTPEALHTIRHELGHAIHRAIETPEINAKLNALRQSIIDERMRRHRQGDHNHKYSDWLSDYGMTNTKEFVAESIAEYLAGNPRETAAKVVEILIGGK